MNALVRSASLTQFRALVAELGADADALVAEVGLPPLCLDDPDLLIPADKVSRVLELAAARTGEPAFGLRLAESRRLSNLGPLGLLLRDEPTLRHALEALVKHMHLHNQALSVRTEQVGNLVTIRLHLQGEGVSRQATELVVGVTFRILSLFLGAAWRPRLVCFVHPAPENRSVHHRVLGRAVEFGHEFNGIVCNAAELEASNPGADPVMSRYSKRLLQQASGQPRSFAGQVREYVVLLLPRGHCRVEVVARHLGVDRRTVARRLAAEGLSFVEVVDGLRRDLLGRYLEEGSWSLGHVAALLGFADLAGFSRWHRTRFGCSATERMRQAASQRGRAGRGGPA